MKITVHRIYSTLAAMVTVLGVSVSPALAQEPEPATRPAQPASVSFPHAVTSEAGTVVVHTPQIDTWKNFESIEARVAVAVTPAGEEEPVFGVAEFTGHTDPNPELRVVATGVHTTRIVAMNSIAATTQGPVATRITTFGNEAMAGPGPPVDDSSSVADVSDY